jgi:hypothetical protein
MSETDLTTHEEAIRLKARQFFTGETCSNGHTAARRTSDGQCTECILETKARCRMEMRAFLR